METGEFILSKAEAILMSDEEVEKLSEEHKRKLAEWGFEDPTWFMRMFLKDKFPSDMPWVHRGALAILTHRTDFLLEYGELDKIISNFVWSEDPGNPSAQLHAIFTPEFSPVARPDSGTEPNTPEMVAIHMRVTKYTLMMLPRGFSKTTLAGIEQLS